MRSRLLILALCCFASCAKLCDLVKSDNDGDENNTAANNATTSATNNTTTAPLADCTGSAIAQTLPFDAGGALPFSFEINARFGNIDASTPSAVSGATFDVVASMPGDFEASYTVLREPIADPRALESDWESRSREPSVVTFDGEVLNAWFFESDERDAVYFMAPHDGELYEATLEWTGPADCVDERRLLRDLATSTLATVDETSFP